MSGEVETARCQTCGGIPHTKGTVFMPPSVFEQGGDASSLDALRWAVDVGVEAIGAQDFSIESVTLSRPALLGPNDETTGHAWMVDFVFTDDVCTCGDG